MIKLPKAIKHTTTEKEKWKAWCRIINKSLKVTTLDEEEKKRETHRNLNHNLTALEQQVNDLQDKPEGLDVSVLSTDSVSGLPMALHPYG